MLGRGVATAVMALAALTAALSPVAAKPKVVADLAGAEVDPEFRCVSQWMTLFALKPPQSDSEKKSALAWLDRLDPFVSEAQNHLIDHYHVTGKDVSAVFVKHRDSTKSEYQRDPGATPTAVAMQCDGLLSLREAARVPTTPQRCWALMSGNAMGEMLRGATAATNREDQIGLAMPGLLGMLSTLPWRKWAKAELIKAGNAEKVAEKMMMAEKKAVDKDQDQALRLGRAVVFDKANCEQRFQAYSAAKKAESVKPPQ
jgi:hypothetical protein